MTGWALVAVGLPLLTVVLDAARNSIGLPSVLVIYLLYVCVVAAVGGFGPALVTALASTAAANWYFTQPLYTLRIKDPEHLIAVAQRALGQDGKPLKAKDLAPYYLVQSQGEARVADRQTQVLGILPTDALRYGYRFFLDTHTGLPLLLRSQVSCTQTPSGMGTSLGLSDRAGGHLGSTPGNSHTGPSPSRPPNSAPTSSAIPTPRLQTSPARCSACAGSATPRPHPHPTGTPTRTANTATAQASHDSTTSAKAPTGHASAGAPSRTRMPT